MPIHQNADRYREIEVNTASPVELVILLYDAAIAKIQAAEECLAARNIEARTRHLNRATAVIGELQATLNFSAGGDIALSLDRLYQYMIQRIFQANLKQDAGPLREVVRLLSNLRSAWIQTAQSEKRKTESPGLPLHQITASKSTGAGELSSFDLTA